MIINEQNKERDKGKNKKEGSELIKKILNLNLPKNYHIKFEDNYVKLIDKSFLTSTHIANLVLEKLDNEIIIVTFDSACQEELDELRESFKNSENKFKIKI